MPYPGYIVGTEGAEALRTIREILEQSKTIAVIGRSPRPDRDSHRVARYLKEQGYRVIPVHPRAREVLGERCYPRLLDVPGPVDLVDIFRRSEDVPPVVDEAIAKGAKAVWMQLGITNEEAAEKARRSGLAVVMDKCTLIEHKRLIRGEL